MKIIIAIVCDVIVCGVAVFSLYKLTNGNNSIDESIKIEKDRYKAKVQEICGIKDSDLMSEAWKKIYNKLKEK